MHMQMQMLPITRVKYICTYNTLIKAMQVKTNAHKKYTLNPQIC